MAMTAPKSMAMAIPLLLAIACTNARFFTNGFGSSPPPGAPAALIKPWPYECEVQCGKDYIACVLDCSGHNPDDDCYEHCNDVYVDCRELCFKNRKEIGD